MPGFNKMTSAIVRLLKLIYEKLRFLFKSSPPSLFGLTLSKAHDGLNKNIFTSEILTRLYLQRIKEVNQVHRSVLETNPEAVSIAQRLDDERKRCGPRGPLHGIPILLQDNIVTLDQMNTSCGYGVLFGTKPEKESAVVSVLRGAGAVILGKINMEEWCEFDSTEKCDRLNFGGSSKGGVGATAVRLGFAVVGIEASNGIINSAERVGVVGYKPTKELIPSDDIIRFSKSQDMLGVLTLTVEDATIITKEILYQVNFSQQLGCQNSIRPHIFSSYLCIDLNGIRVGVPDHLNELQNLPAFKQDAFASILSALKKAGAEIVRNVEILGAAEYELLSEDCRNIVYYTDLHLTINSYLSSLTTNRQNITSLHELILYIKKHPQKAFSQPTVEMLERAEATCPLAPFYQKMRIMEDYFIHEGGIADALDRENLHVLLVPVSSATLQTFAAKAGSPVLSVPMESYLKSTKVGYDTDKASMTVSSDFSFSLFVYGRRDEDDTVLKVGIVLERTKESIGRLKRPFLPTTDLVDISRLDDFGVVV